MLLTKGSKDELKKCVAATTASCSMLCNEFMTAYVIEQEAAVENMLQVTSDWGKICEFMSRQANLKRHI